MRNLVLDHAISMIFQRNYLSRMIRYDTQAAYRGTASRGDLIVASHRMSRMIDPRRPRGPSLQQLQHLRQDAGIQELRERQQNLYDQIRDRSIISTGLKVSRSMTSTSKSSGTSIVYSKRKGGR